MNEPETNASQERLEKLIVKNEGLRHKAYQDTKGIWTIGVGRNIQEVGISEEEAYFLLRNDIKRCYDEAKQFSWFEYLETPRQHVIIDMLFNLGLTRFKKFTRMISALETADFTRASAEMMDSKWSRDVGSRADRNAYVMLYGDYQKGEE